MSTFGKRLREAREAIVPKLTQEGLGKKFDPPVSRNAVSRWESDTDMPETDKLPTLARAVRETVDYLLTGRGKRSSSNTEQGPEIKGRVPLISWVQAGEFSQVVDNFHPGDAEEWVETTVPIHQHTYALRIRGDSMTNPHGEPTFPDGSVIVVEPDAIGDLPQMLGQYVIVKRNGDGEATFKKLVQDAGRYYLKPLNPQYPTLELKESDIFCGVVRERVMRFF